MKGCEHVVVYSGGAHMTDETKRRRMLSHTVRQQQLGSARTTLIDALRLCDEGKLDEAFVGCALAMVHLRHVTNEERVTELVRDILHRAVERERKKKSAEVTDG